MAAAASTGMEKAEMKALLNKATPDKPINFAFGLGKDPNLALLKMDKLKNPKAVDKMLGDQFSDLKTSRWGTVTFDETEATLKFLVNKPVSNVAAKLVKTLKGTGFHKVQIVLEDGTVAEEAGGEEEAAAATAAPEKEQAAAAPTEAKAAAQPDRAALVAELTKLVQAVPSAIAADPMLKDKLGKLAAVAGASIKTDLEAAPAAIGELRQALDAATQSQPVASSDKTPSRADVTATLKDLLQQIPAAIAANPAAKAGLAKLAGEANEHLKANDPAGAAAILDQLRDALGQDGGLKGRLTDLAAQASVLPEPARSELLGRVKQAQAKPDAGEIETFADAIAEAAKAARVAQAQAQAGNTVTFRLLQKKWNAAEDRAQKQFGVFLDALLSDPELQADERYPELQAEATRLEALIPDDAGQLTAALGVLDDADETQRPQAQKKAAAALEAYRADLAAAEALRELQDVADQFYGGQPFLSELQSALADLGGELAKRG